MKPQHYNHLLVFLETQQFSLQFNQKQKQQLTKTAKYFINQNGSLYHKDELNSDNLQRVIKQSELEIILYNTHDSLLTRHLKLEATLNCLQHKYFWYNMKQTVQKYISECEVCQRERR